MNTTLYLTSTESHSGKVTVLLGLFDWLYRLHPGVSVFRPVIAQSPDEDRFLQLINHRYELPHAIDKQYGCKLSEARKLLQQQGENALQQHIMTRFKALEANSDGVLCIGTDFGFHAPALELDFNIETARNLGAGIVLISNGSGRSADENLRLMQALTQRLSEHGADVLAGIVNRIAPNDIDATRAALAAEAQQGMPIFTLPEDPVLERPTLGDLTRTLSAKTLIGCSEDLNRDIGGIKVAAMEVANFLTHLADGDLVITPGDRADILLATLAAHRSTTYPQIAGLLLSGGLFPHPAITRLLDGQQDIPVAVFSTATDTFETALAANQVSQSGAELRSDNQRKLAAALGLMETHVDIAALLTPLSLPRARHTTPLMFEYQLLQRARQDRRHIVLPEGNDERILRAAEILLLREVVTTTILGDPEQVQTLAASLGVRLDGAEIIDPAHAPQRQRYAERYFALRQHKGISEQMAYDTVADVSYFGTMMVLLGDADGMVSGAAHTTQHTIRPAFEVIRTRPDAKLVSSVFFMCLPDHVLVYGDCAINPEPNAEQLAAIAIASADTAAGFGVTPRVALLSYSTGASGKGSEVDKVRQATAIARQRRPDLLLEGPIQYDAAIDPGVAASKLPDSQVAGRATVLIFPDLNTGNNTYKAVQRSAGAVAVGPVLQGLNKPVNDLSRGCTVTDIVNTVAITAIQAQSQSQSTPQPSST